MEHIDGIYNIKIFPIKAPLWRKPALDEDYLFYVRSHTTTAFFTPETWTITIKWNVIKQLPYPKIQLIAIIAHEVVHVFQFIFSYKLNHRRMNFEYSMPDGWNKIERPAVLVQNLINSIFFWRLL